MAEIVVTGGQGFIGSNLTKSLMDLGMDVCSTYSYTPPVYSSRSNLSFFRLDITQFSDCLKLINQENPKLIYHFVAQPLVTAASRHPFPTLDLTIRGAYNLLEAVRQSGKDVKIIMFTSDKVYGENINALESDRLDTVLHPYEVAKVCEDMLGRSYAKSFGMSVVTVRSANVYGRRDLHWDRLIPHICKSLIHNVPPVFRSDGTQLRDYLYIDDVLNGLLLAGEKLTCEVMNLGAWNGQDSLTILDTLISISGKSNLRSLVEFSEVHNEINQQHINWDYAKSLGWSPQVSLEDGLIRAYQWYDEWFHE